MHIMLLVQTNNRLMPTFPGQPGLAGTRKVKPIWILIKQEMMEWQWHQLDRMQIIFAPRCRWMTTPALHQSIFTGRMLFMTPNQQCQSTEGMSCYTKLSIHLWCNWGGPIGVVKPDQPAGNRKYMAFMRERAKQFCRTEMSDIKLDSDALR